MLPARVTAALGLAAQEAEAIYSELPTYLASHSQRTYLWGSALGTHDGLDYDEELLYISCLLHDRGLPPAVERRDEKCFTLASASVADEHARRSGWPKERAASLSEAITLHLNPWVSPAQGIEAHLLNAGAAVDVAGCGAGSFTPRPSLLSSAATPGRTSSGSSGQRSAPMPKRHRGAASIPCCAMGCSAQ